MSLLDRVEAVVEPLVVREGGAPPGWKERMAHYLELLLEKNRVVNLVSRASADRVVEEQVAPSLAGLLVLPRDTPMKVLDVGSGGGFPGIPLKIVRPDIRLDLVEATRKKSEFLESILSEFGWIDDRVHWCRVESPTRDLEGRAPFERAFARAVGSDDRLIRGISKLLDDSRSLWVFGGPNETQSLGEALDWTGLGGAILTRLTRPGPRRSKNRIVGAERRSGGPGGI